MMIWLSNLSGTDAYFSVYVLIAFFSFFCSLKNDRKPVVTCKKQRLILLICSVIFSLITLSANYPLFTLVRDPATIQASTNLLVNLINTCFSFIGGISVSHPILSWLLTNLPLRFELSPRSDKEKPYFQYVSITFALISLIYLLHLFCVEYPGNLTEDPFTQIGEMVSGSYSNFNTFWHTMLMQGILSFGYFLFEDVNAAVACFCTVQALVIAFAFTYTLATLYLVGMPKYVLCVVFLVYAILPYNIALSITVWKDVLFSAGCLLTIVSLYRILKSIGSRTSLNYAILIIGGFLFSFSRNNGWYIYLAALLISSIPLRKNKKVLGVLTGVFLICWTMCNPVLTALHVSGADYTESLSIPLQQIARVVADNCELSEEDTQLLSQVFELDEIPGLYTNWISDPIKIAFRDNNPEYFEAHVSDYVKLWIRLGLKYPGEYFKAWVDQTKGYWNGGYSLAPYSETVTDNPYGIEKADQNNLLAKLFGLYFGLSRHVIFFEPLHSIGLHTWLLAICCLMNCMQKRKEEALLCVLPLVLVLGLCFGTPVFASFRYAYPVFVSLPLIAPLTVFRVKK